LDDSNQSIQNRSPQPLVLPDFRSFLSSSHTVKDGMDQGLFLPKSPQPLNQSTISATLSPAPPLSPPLLRSKGGFKALPPKANS
ncbi:MAG: hypothetical protein ABF381_10745, partial [Akkermansiaceae bacterium]